MEPDRSCQLRVGRSRAGSPRTAARPSRRPRAPFRQGSQYVSIRYTERLAEAGIEPSVGSVGDSYDNAPTETINGLYKAELIHRRRPWRSFEAVEFATLTWADWFNNRRLPEPIGNIPPAEAEERYYAMLSEPPWRRDSNEMNFGKLGAVHDLNHWPNFVPSASTTPSCAEGKGRAIPQTSAALAVMAQGRFAMKVVCEVLGVARSNIAARAKSPLGKPRQGRPALPDNEMVMAIQAIITDMPSYGYRRVWALLRRVARAEGRPAPNHKRVYRVMKARGLLLQRHAGGVEARRHDGRIAVDRSNLRWCSDGFELGCDNGEKVRIAFALDCCDREAISFVATTEGIKGEDVRDLMTVAVETRFGPSIVCPA